MVDIRTFRSLILKIFLITALLLNSGLSGSGLCNYTVKEMIKIPIPSYDFINEYQKKLIGHIKYKGTIRTGEIVSKNTDETYNVKIAMSDQVYPNIESLIYDDVYQVGEIVAIGFEYGSKENPKILGHDKKVAQVPVVVEVDYAGIARVETLNAYTITSSTAYLEARISLGGAGNCKTRGFEYGLTTAYGDDTHTDNSYGDGSYSIKIEDLTAETTYHFRAYLIDENDDYIYGSDKTFTTAEATEPTIDIGDTAEDRTGVFGAYTIVAKANPAEKAGKITSVEIWANSELTNCEVATFFVVSGNQLSTRDNDSIGTVTAGEKKTFPVELDVEIGDYIGIYYDSGQLERSIASGLPGVWYKSGDNIPITGAYFTSADNQSISLYGTGD